MTFIFSLANTSEMSRSRPCRSAASTDHVDRIDRRACRPARRAPLDLDHALRRRARPSRGSCCSRARWIAHALAARDEAADRVGRRRLAAARQLRQQRIDADHQHAALGRLSPARERFAAAITSSGVRRRLGRAQQRLDVAQRELVLADHLEQVVGADLKPSCAARSSSLTAVLPSRCSSFSTSSRPRAIVSCLRLRVEPGAHLGARARGWPGSPGRR